MAIKPRFRVQLDDRYTSKSAGFPVVLYIYINPHKRLIPIGVTITQARLDYWYENRNKNHSSDFKNIANKIDAVWNKADKIITTLPEDQYNMDSFLAKWNEPEKGDIVTVKHGFQEYIDHLEKHEQLGTANVHRYAMKSIDKFRSGILLKDVNKDFLQDYENDMLTKGRSTTTINFYLTALSIIMNNAIESKIISIDNYPFGKKKYIIPKGNNTKKALSIEDIKKIFEYKCEPGSALEKAKDYWTFIYLANGMNPIDVCKLKYCDFDGDSFSFIRTKIKRSKPERITVIVNNWMKDIINKYETKGKLNDYVFPILENGISAKEERLLNVKFFKQINYGMKVIAEKLDLPKIITTYTARHSFATILKNSGTPIEEISESLGHKSLKTTQNYLDQFTMEKKKANTAKLTAFS